MRNNPALIIKNGKEKEFFTKMRAAQPTQEFWNDCRQIRKNITAEAMEELNKLMDSE